MTKHTEVLLNGKAEELLKVDYLEEDLQHCTRRICTRMEAETYPKLRESFAPFLHDEAELLCHLQHAELYAYWQHPRIVVQYPESK